LLTRLEYLELDLDDWLVLLDADAVKYGRRRDRR
jgi:hypothetical protein